ncbi:MAG: hypothetical protein GX614_01795 [Sandaracinaceae bacterium]|nr:hypothetical protein [Sandaracinaceae bacterium]
MKTLALRSLSVFFAAMLALAPLAALAEHPDEERTALEDRSTSFQAVTGPVTEDVPGGTLLIAAYLAIWAATMLYLLRLARLGKRIDADLNALKESLPAEDSGALRGNDV